MDETKFTKFNPEGKAELTYGDLLRPAMSITEQEDADQYLVAYVAHIQEFLDKEPRADGLTAEQIAKTNLGYFAGYYDSETRERVERLFRCQHPVFGAIAANGPPTPEETFAAGVEYAETVMSDTEAPWPWRT